MKKQQGTHNEPDDEPLSLDMTFDEALELLVNTPPPDKRDEEEVQQEERKQDEDC